MPRPFGYEGVKRVPRTETVAALDSREPEPYAVDARARIIRRDADAIKAECQQAAGGDWKKWQQATAIYRDALDARTDSLEFIDPLSERDSLSRFAALEGRDGFPLFEINARDYLCQLYKPETLNQFRQTRAVVAATRWLHERNIDLIFVPVPKMTGVYIEHFLDPCPLDGIIAPHVRRTLLELLENDVEVVDAFPKLRRLQSAGGDYLYNTADTHWSPRAMRMVAKLVADRIERYRFCASQRYNLPIVKTTTGPFKIRPMDSPTDDGLPTQNGWAALTADQQMRAAAVQTRTIDRVTMLDDSEPLEDPGSPVLLIGDSFVPNFREQLIRELNLLISTKAVDDHTTEIFSGLLREPEFTAHCRVVVWITNEQHMTRFRHLPEPIMATLKSGK
jgi:hypothetical protein